MCVSVFSPPQSHLRVIGRDEKAAPLFCSEEPSAVLSGVKNREWNSRR